MAGYGAIRITHICLADTLHVVRVWVEHARREEPCAADPVPQAADHVGIAEEARERRRCLDKSEKRADRLRERRGSSRKSPDRMLRDEIHNGHTGYLINMMQARRDPRIRRDPHRPILVRIAEGARRPFDADEIGPAADIDAKRESTRRPAPDGHDRFDLGSAECRPDRRMDRLAMVRGTSPLHDEGFLVLFCKKEQALLFAKRSKNSLP